MAEDPKAPKEGARAKSPGATAKSDDGDSAKRFNQQIKNSRMEISDDGLKAIKAWQYKGGTYTPLDTFLNKFVWTPCAELLPTWLAPNMVTLIGLGWIVLGYIVLVMYYSRDFHTAAPRWVYFFVAFANFMYQTLDAMDGKHARRLGASSPLGQLFDHGCDSVSLTFIAMTVATATRLGFGVRSVALLASFQVPFWLKNWEEYHTHRMEHSMWGLIGITEGQTTGMITMALGGVLGPDVWLYDLGLGTMPAWYCGGEACPVTLQDLGLFFQCFAGFLFCRSSFVAVYEHAENKSAAFLQTVPMFLLVLLGIAWCVTIPHSRTHPRLVVFSLGMAFTYLANKLIVAGMCKMEYKAFHTILVPLPIIFVINRLELLPRHNDVLLGGYCAYSIYKLWKYTINVVQEISQFLGIYVLTLGKRSKDE